MPPLGSTGRLFTSFSSSAAGNASVAARSSASRLACDVRDAAARGRVTANNDSWQVTDLYSRAEQEPNIIFTDEAVDETAVQMLGQAYRVEEPDEGQDANAQMQAAEAHMFRNPLNDLMPVIRSMLRDPNIQRAAMAHLRQSPHFQQYLLASATADQSPAPLAIEWLPTETHEAGTGPTGLQGLIDELGAKLMAAGEAALKTAIGMRNAVGRLLIHLGASLHAMLGQPFSKAPLEEAMSEEEMDEKAERVGQALVTVAVAILSIVFLKRAHLVAAL